VKISIGVRFTIALELRWHYGLSRLGHDEAGSSPRLHGVQAQRQQGRSD